MRTIEFKGKRKNNNEWVYGDLAYFFGKIPCIMEKIEFPSVEFDKEEIGDKQIMLGGFVEVIPETVGQFTGRYDKENNKICEGDIVYDDAYDLEMICIWNDEELCFELAFEEDRYEMRLSKSRYLVVGNIHDFEQKDTEVSPNIT